MRRVVKEKKRYICPLTPIERRSIRCKNAFNKYVKYDKSRPKNRGVVVREYFSDTSCIYYAYKFTSKCFPSVRLNELFFDIAITDSTGRLKEYRAAGDKYRIKAHLLDILISYKQRSYFALYINDTVYPLLTLKDIQFTDNKLRICKGGAIVAWIYYRDIKRLEVL